MDLIEITDKEQAAHIAGELIKLGYSVTAYEDNGLYVLHTRDENAHQHILSEAKKTGTLKRTVSLNSSGFTTIHPTAG